MPIGHRMITVMTPDHRVELLVPDAMTAAELVPEVLELLASESAAATAAGPPASSGLSGEAGRLGLWSLARPGGRPIPPDEPLAMAGVRDGDGLLLVPDIHEFVAPSILPHLPGTGVAGSRPSWSKGSTRAVLLILAAVALGASAWAVAQVLPALAALRLAGGGASVWSTVAVLVGRIGRPGRWRRRSAMVLAVACAPLILVVAVLAPIGTGLTEPSLRVLAISLAIFVASWLPAAAAPGPATRSVGLAGAMAAGPVILTSAAAWRWGLPLSVVAAIVAGVNAILIQRGAALAVGLHRMIGFGPASARPASSTPGLDEGPYWTLESRTPDDAARIALLATLLGLTVTLGPAWAVLSAGTWLERWLVVVTGAVVAAQTRWLRVRRHRLVVTLSALVAFGALVYTGLSAVADPLVRAGSLWALAIVAVVAVIPSRQLALPAWVLRIGEVMEVLAVAAVVPLLADELGFFALVGRAAHRWVG